RGAELGEGAARSNKKVSWLSLFIEKVPFFALAFAASVATVVAQRAGGAVRTVADVPYGLRILNSLTAYAHYAGKAIWPAHLSIYYLLPAEVPVAPAICAALVMLGVSYLAFRWRASCPWFIIGWLWFVGMLVPVIGLVQVGSQAMADRYTYVPLIGLFIAAMWSLDRALGAGQTGRIFGVGLATVSLLACVMLTRSQLGHWRNSVSLFQHAVEVTPDNYFAEYELGTALANAGRNEEAITHHTTALRINPLYEPAHYHIGLELAEAGKLDDAVFHFSEALKRDPGSEELHNNLGVIFAQQNKLDPAIAEFKQAIQINPSYSRPYLNYALALQRLGQAGAALTNFAKARELDPASPLVMMRLAYFLATCPDPQWRNPAAAVQLAETANEFTQRQSPPYLATLATANAAAGNYSNAIVFAELARTKAQEQHLQDWVKKIETDLALYRLGQNPPANWQQPQP
ncbi:MAG: Tetratricopeptide 2 repeat protein, partial [Pedosphaera sp.]|nr:Tetratricopeptide 2 repeat protein [Pedosphaera sp.]